MAVVVAFFICWAPFHTQRLLVIYVPQPWTSSFTTFMHLLFYISGVLYFISSVINPILYNIMSLKFRRAFKNSILSPCREVGRRRKAAFIAYKFCHGHMELDSDRSASRLQPQQQQLYHHPAARVNSCQGCESCHGGPQRSESRSHSSGRGGAGSSSNRDPRVLNALTPMERKSLSSSDSKLKGVLIPRTASITMKYESRPYHSYA